VTAPVAPWDLLRELAPQVLGAVVRRYGHFDLCEDAVQEALLAASVQWPRDGQPASPRAWLITVASRRLAVPRPLHRGGQQRLLHGVLAQAEMPVPAHDRAEDLRRELAQQVPGRSGRGHGRPVVTSRCRTSS